MDKDKKVILLLTGIVVMSIVFYIVSCFLTT